MGSSQSSQPLVTLVHTQTCFWLVCLCTLKQTQASLGIEDLKNLTLTIFSTVVFFRLVNHVGQRVARLMGEGHSQGTAWNNSTIDLVHAAKVSQINRKYLQANSFIIF